MSYPTVEELVTRYGYRQRDAELEVKRANCEHDYGDRCEQTRMGCVRTCLKCGQMLGLGGHCWELKAKREAAAASPPVGGAKGDE
jgi:hypothetical protein